ncbi:MAG: MBL fold metallo-hydrolase [Pseudomonadota bacterium]
MKSLAAALAAMALAACAGDDPSAKQAPALQCEISLVVLGVAQDGGKPQTANPDDPAWDDPTLQRLATSLALVDRRDKDVRRWMFEATPDFKEQLQRLDRRAPVERPIGLDGIFLTHAHIGHYAGLMLLGFESVGAENVVVYAMPRMADFLAKNGPWSQLVSKHNIILAIMADSEAESLSDGLAVTPFLVPHRQEFSEVVGYRIDGPERSALFIPDIDSWEDWDREGTRIEDVIASVDIAYLDATFYADGEIPGRDMSGFPHPFVAHSMERFADLPDAEKAKIRFIHMNHTNPLLRPDAAERAQVRDEGFKIAKEGEEVCL